MGLNNNCTKCGVRLADWEKSYRVISHLCHCCYGKEQDENAQLRQDLADMVDRVGELEDENLQLRQDLADAVEIIRYKAGDSYQSGTPGSEGIYCAECHAKWGKKHKSSCYVGFAQEWLNRPSVRALIKEQP